MSTFGVIDIWRVQHPTRKKFTWRSEKPCKASRDDYVFTSEDVLSLNQKVDILNSYGLTIMKSPLRIKGKGFNNPLLENRDFVEMIKEEIQLVQQTYALPVYDIDFVTSDHGESLNINISFTLFFETLLCQMRGKMIKFSKSLKRKVQELSQYFY